MKKLAKYLRDGRAPVPINESTSRIMSRNKAKNTGPELVLRKALWRNGVRGYRIHWRKVPGSPDIAFLKKRLAIFVNGCFWHRCPNCSHSIPKTNTTFWNAKFDRNIERDKVKIEMLKNIGWNVIVIWECMIKNDILEAIEIIKKELENGNKGC